MSKVRVIKKPKPVVEPIVEQGAPVQADAKQPTIVVYELRKHRYRAYDAHHPDVRNNGGTAASAIGNLIRNNPEHFGITVKTGVADAQGNVTIVEPTKKERKSDEQ